ncbi:sodium- and chloride-dependent GABA transporter 2-like [Styela clava]
MTVDIEMDNVSPESSFLSEKKINLDTSNNKSCTNATMSVQTRETWSNKAQSFCTVLGAIIGMGNLWRFPYICYKYGGGAFLLPYIFCVAFIGFPLFFLETALGQFTKQGAIGAWNIAPLMRGVGIGSAVLVTYSCIYFIIIIAWGFFYLFHSFTIGDLPFTTCDNWWNTDKCRPYSFKFDTNNTDYAIISNRTFTSDTSLNNTDFGYYEAVSEENRTLPISEFWDRYVLRKSDSLEDYGTLDNWMMVICLAVAWITCYLCIIKGIKSAGRVAMFTATFPYVLLLVIMIRGCTLPGAIDGIYYYLKPNMTKLAEPLVWVQAGSQVCYSYAIGFAALITMGSFNEFHKDCYRHCILLVGSCAGTSFITGFAVFSILGNLAFVTNKNVSDVVESGPGLVFQTFPTALSLLPLPHLWNALFFFMLIIIGLDSQFACVECIIVLITDHWPAFFTRKNAKELLRTFICGTMMIIGLIFLPAGGIYVFELFNNYAVSGIAVLWIAMMESIAIAYFYGIDNFYKNIEQMIGFKPSPFIKICWMVITPLLTGGIMVFYIFQYEPLTIKGYKYPPWADAIGWIMCMSSFLCVPAVFIYTLCQKKGSLKERWVEASQPRLGSHIDVEKKMDNDSEEGLMYS